MIPIGAFEEWEWLFQWVAQSQYDYRGNSDWGEHNMWGWLEEQLNYINRVDIGKTEANDMQLDLLLPIKPKLAASITGR